MGGCKILKNWSIEGYTGEDLGMRKNKILCYTKIGGRCVCDLRVGRVMSSLVAEQGP